MRERASQFMTIEYNGSYNPDVYRYHVFETEPEGPLEEREFAPLISLESILSVQSLAMGFLRYRARTRKSWRDDRKHGFAMSETTGGDTSEPSVYDGSVTEYMSCLVRKLSFDQWHMKVMFRENHNTQDEKAKSYLDMYAFDWLRGGNRMAWGWSQEIRSISGQETQCTYRDVHRVGDAEAEDLRSRMIEKAERVNPLAEDSIFAPVLKSMTKA